MEEDIAEKVTMVTVAKQNSSNTGESYRHNEYRNNRNNRPTRDDQGQRRGRQEPSGPPVTECAFCELIRNKDVNQELLKIEFKERHQVSSTTPIFANQCPPWSLCAPVLMYEPHQPPEPPMDSLPHITPYHQLDTLLNRYVND